MANSNSPSRLDFNNVISLGVSYSWEHGLTNSPQSAEACPDLNGGKSQSEFIKRTKQVNLDVLNLDFENAGGSALAKMANNQSKYVATNAVSVYANGAYAGNGKLIDYSINEGSLSNSSVTNLTYEMSDGDPDSSDTPDRPEDPVTRDETITVSRNVKEKSYTIEHSYSINFGDDFNLITDHPLYQNDPTYASVHARLALGENEANQAIYNNPVDYSAYIDLSSYVTANGWNLSLLKNGCSGVLSSSSETRDFINGSYSKTRTTNLRYTGQNLDQRVPDYELEYSMSWSEETRNNSKNPCAVVRMDGTVKGLLDDQCEGSITAAELAESGYNKFITEGGKQKVISFFNYIQNNIDGVPSGPPNEDILDLKKTKCNPSVDRGGNDGVISFSFEMNNCPNHQNDNGLVYSYDETSTKSLNIQKDCNNQSVPVTEITINGQVDASECYLQMDQDGSYPRYEAIQSIGPSKQNLFSAKASGLYDGEFANRFKIKSEEFSYNPYEGTQSFSETYSDATNTDDCVKRSNNDPCADFKTTETIVPKLPRYVDTVSAVGIVTERKGFSLPTKKVSTSISYPLTECEQITDLELLEKVRIELNSKAPSCNINSFSWALSNEYQKGQSVSAEIGGINL